MRVLFVLPPFRHGRNLMAMGPAYIAAMLLRKGHTIQVVDADAFEYTRDELISIFGKLQYDVVAMGGIATAYKFVKMTADDIKRVRPDVKIISGGNMVTPSPELIMRNSGVDIGVIGEGEVTMVELLDALENDKPLHNINGIIFRDGDTLVTTNTREFISDLDSLPFPAWDYFYAKGIYSRVPFPPNNIFKASRTMNITTGRGCPYQCTFCSYDTKVRLRSVDNIMQELEELKRRYKIGSFIVNDDLFLVSRKRAIEFCNRLIKSKLKLQWKATGRVNLVDKEILTLFKKSGCTMVAYGIESGSPRMLKRIKKQITPKQVEDAMRWTVEAGIRPGGTWILGLPDEDRESVKETAALYKNINRYRDNSNPFFFATAYPGTELYEEMKSMGKIGDEDKYMEELSTAGDALKFVRNCTTAFSNDELIGLKKSLDAEVREDLYQKHRFLRLKRRFLKVSGLNFLNKLIISIKVQGPILVLRKALSRVTKKSPYGKPYLDS